MTNQNICGRITLLDKHEVGGDYMKMEIIAYEMKFHKDICK